MWVSPHISVVRKDHFDINMTVLQSLDQKLQCNAKSNTMGKSRGRFRYQEVICANCAPIVDTLRYSRSKMSYWSSKSVQNSSCAPTRRQTVTRYHQDAAERSEAVQRPDKMDGGKSFLGALSVRDRKRIKNSRKIGRADLAALGLVRRRILSSLCKNSPIFKIRFRTLDIQVQSCQFFST